MLNTALRLIRYGSVGGNVYVSNLRFYNKQTVESGKYLNNTDNGKSIKDFDYFWKTDKIQTAIPGTSGNVSTVEALKMSYVYGTGSGAYMQNKLKLNRPNEHVSRAGTPWRPYFRNLRIAYFSFLSYNKFCPEGNISYSV